MAGRIPKNFIDELLARADVAEVVGRRITLKKQAENTRLVVLFITKKRRLFKLTSKKVFIIVLVVVRMVMRYVSLWNMII